MNAVCLVIPNSSGAPAGETPAADFSIDNLSPNVGDTLQLTDESLHSPTQWAWYVNEVLFSNDQNPTFYCSTPGFFRFVLTAENSYGGNTSPSQTVLVSAGGGGGGNEP